MFVKPLTVLFNRSFMTGVFPDSVKIAKVVPIYKNGSKHSICNYRPISILPVLSKIFEKLVHKQLLSFIEKHNLLTDSQYGFRAKRTTEMAIASVINTITEAIENKEVSIGINYF